MNRVIQCLVTILFSLLITFSSNHTADAQIGFDRATETGDITFGAALSRGSSVGHLEESEFGVTLQIYYGITEEIRGGASYTYYIISENDLGASEFNLDGHYFFRNRDNVIVYGLGGLNISRIQAESETWGNISRSNIGINAGVGLEIGLGNIALFGEPKFTIAGWNQFLITAGVRLRF